MPSSAPLALIEAGAHGLTITAATRSALAAGVTIGAALADTRAMLPDLLTRPAEPARDQAALTGLVRWLGRYGPARNRDGPDGAWIDVTGVPHLFGGEAALARDLVDRLASLGVTARLGLADTLGAAHALARFAAAPHAAAAIAPPGEARGALASLSVAALRLAPEAVRLLERLGLRRIGQLYGIPRAALERRFRETARKGRRPEAAAHAGAVLLRLDQALGLVAEPRAALAEPPASSARLGLAEPLISAEGLAAALRHVAGDLGRHLADRDLGARRFTLDLYRADGTVAGLRIATSVACRDPGHICRLLEARLSSIDAGFGIDVVVLAAADLGPLANTQAGLGPTAGQPATADPWPLIDRLAGRLGGNRVYRLVPVASHIPERAECPLPALAGPPPAATPKPAALAYPRPALMLAPPEPIAVVALVPDGAPARLVWRRVTRRIVRAEGPERIAPEWWGLGSRLGCPVVPQAHSPSARAAAGDTGRLPSGQLKARQERTRDYYRLEDDTGAGYWVFREGLYGREDEAGDAPPRWFLQGLFA